MNRIDDSTPQVSVRPVAWDEADGTNTARDNIVRELPPIPHFGSIVGHEPYPWQRCLYGQLVEGEVPEAVDIPTGLGKTACVLLALLARLANPALPRRVVYIVDRRAIVDQTAEIIRAWIARIGALPELAREFNACAAFPASRPVGLGVLRGGMSDDGKWRVDPARPTVVVGTVDMIGSRLLFRGYGAGRSRRAMDAGLLGHDALVLLDEAHLAPAMGGLLREVGRLQGCPAYRVMTLSATSAGEGGNVVTLSALDLADPAVRRRLDAPKRASLRRVATPAARIGAMCEAAASHRTGAVAIYVESVAGARRIASRLARGHGPERVAVLTGTLRGRERSALANGAVWQRFAPGRERAQELPAVYLVATSAGEVGVDIDADHAVMDLTTLESLIQRLGRVNRTGGREATVTIVYLAREAEPPARPPRRSSEKLRAARLQTLEVLRSLPGLCPDTLRDVDRATLAACSAPSATPARLDPVVVESYAATSADLQLPPVDIYLRGIAEEPDYPESWLAWREDIPALVRCGAQTAGAVLSFFRPGPQELARVPARYAMKLVHRALRRQDGRGLPVVVVRPDGEVYVAELRNEADVPSLAWATVILPPGAGGLLPSGLPDVEAAFAVADVGDTDDRIRYTEDDENGRERPAWLDQAIELRVPMPVDDEDGAEDRVRIYALRRADPDLASAAAGDLTWLGGSEQTVEEHSRWVGETIRRIGEALGLPGPLVESLGFAGEWHDRGKSRRVWQRAAGVPPGAPPLAKSRRGQFRSGWLGGYRHEFGSVADAERSLAEDMPYRDLILHLIAAHHGWARPGFLRPEQWDPEAPPPVNRALAERIADRYARLAAEHGPWRLAWFESLLKAADAWVSRGRDA